MCSTGQQPKMFLNPMSIGSGGQFSTPVQYPSSPQPTTMAPAVPPATPPAPAAPAPTTPASPKKPTAGAGTAGGAKIGNTFLQTLLRRGQ